VVYDNKIWGHVEETITNQVILMRSGIPATVKFGIILPSVSLGMG